MYICKVTGTLSKPGEKLNKITVKSRERVYTQKFRNEETNKWEDVEVGQGHEIVQEINASQAGVDLWESWSTENRVAFLATL